MSHFKPFNKKKKRSVYLGEFTLSPDIWIVLAAVSQLERELIIERVKVGLANARAKGKIIGRKKQRNSDMIRALRKKGLTYRSIADLCGCSHGSVHAEILANQAQANPEPQELSNPQDSSKISDAYTYYETVD